MQNILALVVMGVTGCGKSSVGQTIATAVQGSLIEGDAYHPKANIKKMSAGHPLTDEDRQGWLERLASVLSTSVAKGERPILACSALKKSYRDILRSETPGLGFVFLELSREVSFERVGHRPGHFMPASLVESQFATLEPPTGEPLVLTVDGTLPVAEIGKLAVTWWQESGNLAASQSLPPESARH